MDVDEAFEDFEWKMICESCQSFSCNRRHNLLHYNLIHRACYTPECFHKITCSYLEQCLDVKLKQVLLHMFWT